MLWGISWINVQLMLDDAARVVDLDDNGGIAGVTEHRKLQTKEDIKNYISGML